MLHNFPPPSRSKSSFITFVCVVMLALVSACASPESAQVESGDIESYVPGLPNFSVGALGRYTDDLLPIIEVTVNIPYSNLIFKKEPSTGIFVANFELMVHIEDAEQASGAPLYHKTYPTQLRLTSYDETKSLSEYHFKKAIDVEPGNYKVRIKLTDDASGQFTERLLSTLIPDIDSDLVNASSIQLLGKRNANSQISPLVTYHISQAYDSLFANIQLLIQRPKNQVVMEMALMRFRSDSLAARLPHHFTPLQGSLEYRGIDFSTCDTLQLSRRNFSGISGVITVDFMLPKLAMGNYRIEIKASSDDTSLVFSKVRDFSVRSAGYPRLTTINQLIESLNYITLPKEWEKLQQFNTADSAKYALDAFWAHLFPNRRQANSIFTAYYNRVEDANMMFSTYKDGWKTDPGMVYILFGAPMTVENTLDGMVWYYSTNTYDPGGMFIFERVRNTGGSFPFTHYVLRRGPQFERAFALNFDRWRSGMLR